MYLINVTIYVEKLEVGMYIFKKSVFIQQRFAKLIETDSKDLFIYQ